jgi:hypothetical protein
LRLLFEKPTVAEQARTVAEIRLERADDAEVERLLADLEDLSEEEAEALLGASGAPKDGTR